MWVYEKRLEYPVKIANTNPKLAKMIITQYGGPDSKKIQFAFYVITDIKLFHSSSLEEQ